MRKKSFLTTAVLIFVTFSFAGVAHGQEVFWYAPIHYGTQSEQFGPIIQGRDGLFYGVSENTIFKIDPSGLYTLLQTLPSGYSFSGQGRLVEGSDGFLYGTAITWNGGIVFKVAPDGTAFTQLRFFDRSTEGRPWFGLVEDMGVFYGILGQEFGGPPEAIFSFEQSGTFTMLTLPTWYTQCRLLVAGRDGGIYGITGLTFFRIEASGQFTRLYDFPSAEGWEPRFLSAGLDGFIYGVASKLGYPKRLFKIDATGVRTWVAYVPIGTYWLAQGRDGLLYGITEEFQLHPYENQQLFGLFRLEIEPSGAFLARYLQTFQIFNMMHETVSLLDTVHGEDGFIYGTININPSPSPEEQFFFRLGTSAQFFAGLEQLQNDFRIVFKNPLFTIPGTNNISQYQNLIHTILNMTKGEKNPIYKGLGGK